MLQILIFILFFVYESQTCPQRNRQTNDKVPKRTVLKLMNCMCFTFFHIYFCLSWKIISLCWVVQRWMCAIFVSSEATKRI